MGHISNKHVSRQGDDYYPAPTLASFDERMAAEL